MPRYAAETVKVARLTVTLHESERLLLPQVTLESGLSPAD